MFTDIIFEARRNGTMRGLVGLRLVLLSFSSFAVAKLSYRYAQSINVLVRRAEDPNRVLLLVRAWCRVSEIKQPKQN